MKLSLPFARDPSAVTLRPRRTVPLAALLLVGCVPPAEPSEPVQEPVPVDDSGIPWAPGEAPEDAEATTRDVGPEPTEQEVPVSDYEADGIHQAGAARCTGKAPPALRALVDVRAQETSACSEHIPASRAGTGGEMKISLKVSESGEVQSVEISSDNLNVPAVSKCVREKLGEPFTEAKPRGGCALFILPLQFDTKEVDEPADGAESP